MVPRLSRLLVAGVATLAVAACMENTSPSQSQLDQASLNAALSSVPVGFGDLGSSFVGLGLADAGNAGLWVGGGREASFDRGDLMGGGLAEDFDGRHGFDGRGGNRGPFNGGLGCTGTFNATTGRIVCPAVTNNGVTINRSAQYKTTAGVIQQAFDTLTTNSANIASTVSGTISFNRAADSASSGDHGHEHWGRGRGPGGRLLGDTSTVLTATTTIASSSSRTTTGLAAGSTTRTVNGTSAGQEATTGTSTRGSFTASRTVGDTTTGLVIPVSTTGPTYPTAGTVIRSMKASLMYTGSAAVTLTRREVITYDGSATAKVVITKDGVVQNCTRALPRGRLVCS